MVEWSKAETRIIEGCYLKKPWTELLEKLKGRNKSGIESKARRMGLTRSVPNTEYIPSTENIETKLLYEEILRRIKKRPIAVHNYFPKNHIKIGLMGDTQLGSLYERLDFLDILYSTYKKEGIEHVYHTGDMLEGGKVYRGQEYEIAYHGVDSQVNHCIKEYPRVEGLTTHFITGNHDLSFYKTAGVDIGEKLIEKRKDMDYIAREYGDILIQGIKLRLIHPSGGTAYAISYKIQKIVESFTGGEKPNIIAVGHFHKAEFLPLLRNVIALQTATLQSQTPFMKRGSLAAHLGGWILDLWIDKKKIVKTKAEFIPFFEG